MRLSLRLMTATLTALLLVSNATAAWSDVKPHLSSNLGFRPSLAFSYGGFSHPISWSGPANVEKTFFYGPGVGGFIDVYHDDRLGFELGYSALMMKAPFVDRGVSWPNTTISALTYVLKYKIGNGTEFGFGGGQFSWLPPHETSTLRPGARNNPPPDASAPGLVFQAAFPWLSKNRAFASPFIQGVFVPGDELTQTIGIAFGLNLGMSVFKGDQVPVRQVDFDSGLPQAPWE